MHACGSRMVRSAPSCLMLFMVMLELPVLKSIIRYVPSGYDSTRSIFPVYLTPPIVVSNFSSTSVFCGLAGDAPSHAT